jgi:hypothetical protein
MLRETVQLTQHTADCTQWDLVGWDSLERQAFWCQDLRQLHPGRREACPCRRGAEGSEASSLLPAVQSPRQPKRDQTNGDDACNPASPCFVFNTASSPFLLPALLPLPSTPSTAQPIFFKQLHHSFTLPRKSRTTPQSWFTSPPSPKTMRSTNPSSTA